MATRSRPDPSPIEITLHGVTHGGEAVGRLPSGKACFVPFAIPGERVLVRLTDERKSWARARLIEVLDASPDRVAPPCPYFGQETEVGPARCGGCALQHISPERQAEIKRQVVREQLQRIGRFEDPPVAETVTPATFGYREQARFAVDADGRLAFRRHGSQRTLPIDVCLLLSPATQATREGAGDRWAGADEVVVRAGDDGSSALVVTPGPDGVPELPAGPAAVALVGADGAVNLRGDATLQRTVAGVSYRVSPDSFFQAGSAAAEALVAVVVEAVAVEAGSQVLDLYAGVGLFARALAELGARVTAVEASRSAADDASANLAGLDAEVLIEPAEHAVARFAEQARWFDTVILDPPRRGAGARLATDLARLEPSTVVYVSCDPAALARDARAMVDAGLRLEMVTPVDAFAQTASIESVAVFRG